MLSRRVGEVGQDDVIPFPWLNEARDDVNALGCPVDKGDAFLIAVDEVGDLLSGVG